MPGGVRNNCYNIFVTNFVDIVFHLPGASDMLVCFQNLMFFLHFALKKTKIQMHLMDIMREHIPSDDTALTRVHLCAVKKQMLFPSGNQM